MLAIGYPSPDTDGSATDPSSNLARVPIPESPRTIDPASVVRTRLPNGLTVLIRRDRSAPVVAIVTYVSAGYFDETDDIVGIAHVLEHMYFKGTPTRGVGEIAKQTKAVGGYLNAATIYDHTSYYTVLPSSGFAQGLDVQADAYARSLIDADELARELEVIIQEAKRKADNPGAVATETLYELLHDRHRIRRWRIGREPGLRALTRDALVGFYRNFYHPGNTVLVDRRRRRSATRRWPRCSARTARCPPASRRAIPGQTEEGVAGFRYREMAGDIGQTQIAFGWRTPGTTHPDTPALDLLARGARQRARVAAVSRGARATARVVGLARTTTRRRRSACSSSTPRRRRRRRATRRARCGISCAPCATATSASSRSSARSESTSRSWCAGSRTWKGRRTTSPSGKRWATGAWAIGTSSAC